MDNMNLSSLSDNLKHGSLTSVDSLLNNATTKIFLGKRYVQLPGGETISLNRLTKQVLALGENHYNDINRSTPTRLRANLLSADEAKAGEKLVSKLQGFYERTSSELNNSGSFTRFLNQRESTAPRLDLDTHIGDHKLHFSDIPNKVGQVLSEFALKCANSEALQLPRMISNAMGTVDKLNIEFHSIRDNINLERTPEKRKEQIGKLELKQKELDLAKADVKKLNDFDPINRAKEIENHFDLESTVEVMTKSMSDTNSKVTPENFNKTVQRVVQFKDDVPDQIRKTVYNNRGLFDRS